MGIKVREVYGMIEIFVIGMGCFEDIFVLGIVGKFIGDIVEVKLFDENEVFMWFEGMMFGYYRVEEKILSVFKDGWFYMGDCGIYDENGNLVVIGCKGDEFKIVKGKFIYLVLLEKCFSGVLEIE